MKPLTTSTIPVEQAINKLKHSVFTRGVGNQGQALTDAKIGAGEKQAAYTDGEWSRAVAETQPYTARRIENTAKLEEATRLGENAKENKERRINRIPNKEAKEKARKEAAEVERQQKAEEKARKKAENEALEAANKAAKAAEREANRKRRLEERADEEEIKKQRRDEEDAARRASRASSRPSRNGKVDDYSKLVKN